jgi:hypothetical protein
MEETFEMRRRKLLVDIVLLVLFGLLCNTRVTGIEFHENAGLVYTALIGVHIVLNRKWLTAAFKGKLRGKNAVWSCVVNTALVVNLVVILVTGILISQELFPAQVKASSAVIIAHAVCGVLAALLVLTHVLLHAKTITQNKTLRKVGLAAVLTVVIGYSLFGGVQGVLRHALPKDSGTDKMQYENHIAGEKENKPKDGEKSE